MNMHRLMLIASLSASSASYAEGPDPYTRDEDISATQVAVEVAQNASGHYVYTYSVSSQSSNLGYVLSFEVDLACDSSVDGNDFDPAAYPSKALPPRPPQGSYVPVAISAPYGRAALYAVDDKRYANWGVFLDPGKSSQGLTLVSPYPPGARAYRLVPDMDVLPPWDYSNVDPDDPTVPWIPDFTVTGITRGPACPGEEDPAPSRFAGSQFPGESSELNELLTYSAPVVDRFHVEEGTPQVKMVVHYGKDIDARSFRVTPANGQLRKLFNPQPGTSATVNLPLQAGRNKIELQVQSVFVPPGQQDDNAQPTHGRGGVSVDRDVFEVRVGSTTGRGGNGRRKQ